MPEVVGARDSPSESTYPALDPDLGPGPVRRTWRRRLPMWARRPRPPRRAMGRPLKEAHPLDVVQSIRVGQWLWGQVRAAAKGEGVTPVEWIRAAMEEKLTRGRIEIAAPEEVTVTAPPPPAPAPPPAPEVPPQHPVTEKTRGVLATPDDSALSFLVACEECWDTGRRVSDGQLCADCTIASQNPDLQPRPYGLANDPDRPV
jgi:hypothetical protein